jgi:hypothetical protein
VSGEAFRKLGVPDGARTIFIGAPTAALETIDPPTLNLESTLTGELDYIHLFVTSAAQLEDSLPEIKAHLAPNGMLWVSWPKGNQLGTDLGLPSIIRIGYRHGLVESKCISIDATWSALKFTHPKPGKTYRNSYGQLPSR